MNRVWGSLLLVGLLMALATSPIAAADDSDYARHAVVLLNLERQANGIPPVTLQPDWECSSDEHGVSGAGWPMWMDPMLAPPFYVDGYWAAPMHLMALIAPGLAQIGFGSNHFCSVTDKGNTRPAPANPTILTYPADGTTGIDPQVWTHEAPFSPGQKLGLASPTGSYLYVLPFGFSDGTLSDARLTGPDGDIPVVTADNSTPEISKYLEPGGMIIPRQPLQPATAYTAHAVFTPFGGAAHSVDFRFTTATPTYPNPAWSVSASTRVDSGEGETPHARLTLDVHSPTGNGAVYAHDWPVTVRATGPDGTAVPMSQDGYDDVAGNWLYLGDASKPGVYRICATAGGLGTPFVEETQCASTTLTFLANLYIPPQAAVVNNHDEIRLRMQCLSGPCDGTLTFRTQRSRLGKKGRPVGVGSARVRVGVGPATRLTIRLSLKHVDRAFSQRRHVPVYVTSDIGNSAKLPSTFKGKPVGTKILILLPKRPHRRHPRR